MNIPKGFKAEAVVAGYQKVLVVLKNNQVCLRLHDKILY
jgi:hypothetical protein